MTLRLTISAGRGPVEVREFVRLLAAALERELSERGLAIEETLVHGALHEPWSIDLCMAAARADVSYLLGTHALVCASARRAKRDRKRWFAGVSCAEVRELDTAKLRAVDVEFSTCRAGGAGGQHVNKTESAVRALHRPSGLSVRIESERSQHQNKARALAALARALVQRDAELLASDRDARRCTSMHVERGRPVASWRVHRGALLRVVTKGSAHAL